MSHGGYRSPHQYLNLRPGIVQPDVKLEAGARAGGASLAPVGACGVYMGNGGMSCAVMPMMCVLSGCL